MGIVRLAFRRSCTFIVMGLLIALLGIYSVLTMSTDTFPGSIYTSGTDDVIHVTRSNSNFIYPDTIGERPKDLEDRLNLQRGLGRLAVRETAVFERLTEVRHLLKSPGLLNDPSIVSRIEGRDPARFGAVVFQVRSRA